MCDVLWVLAGVGMVEKGKRAVGLRTWPPALESDSRDSDLLYGITLLYICSRDT